MTSSSFAQEFFFKGFRSEAYPPMVYQNFGESKCQVLTISDEWTQFFRYVHVPTSPWDWGAPQRATYELTEEAIESLTVRNERGQPLIYVLLRFCNCPELRSAIIRSAPKDALSLTTPDGSTPLIGMMFGLGGSIPPSEIRRIADKVGKDVWNMTNYRGESAASFASLLGVF